MDARRTIAALPLLAVSLWMTAGTALAQNQISPFSDKEFTDVPTSRSDYQAIEYLRSHNYLRGDYTSGRYHPDGRMRRNELVQLMTGEFFMGDRDNACTAGMKPGDTLYTDVPYNDPYGLDICNAKARGIIHGFPDGYFRPTRYVTFVEAAKLVTRILQVSMEQNNPDDHRWYAVYVMMLSDKNAIPMSIGRLNEPVTRGEVAEMIYRLKTDTTNKPSKHWSNFK